MVVRTNSAGFGWILLSFPETNGLLVYGTTYRFHGKVLPKLTAAEFDSMPLGWKADPTGNRMVIHLSAQATPQPPRREIEQRGRTK